MKVFFIGDIVGRPGREFLDKNLHSLRTHYQWDTVIANGENSAGGKGITSPIVNELLKSGIDIITLGDHVWDQHPFINEIDSHNTVSRPANLTGNVPGKPYIILNINKIRIAVITLLGQVFMRFYVENPIETIDKYLNIIRNEADVIIVEVHAEATAEKVALGWYLNGKVTAVIGTHTHIPTADAQILDQGTAYITDVGMTGPYDSVIGCKKELILEKMKTQLPVKFDVATGNVKLSGLEIDIDNNTFKATNCTLLTFS